MKQTKLIRKIFLVFDDGDGGKDEETIVLDTTVSSVKRIEYVEHDGE